VCARGWLLMCERVKREGKSAQLQLVWGLATLVVGARVGEVRALHVVGWCPPVHRAPSCHRSCSASCCDTWIEHSRAWPRSYPPTPVAGDVGGGCPGGMGCPWQGIPLIAMGSRAVTNTLQSLHFIMWKFIFMSFPDTSLLKLDDTSLLQLDEEPEGTFKLCNNPQNVREAAARGKWLQRRQQAACRGCPPRAAPHCGL
jgi:hypothetical protein